MNIHGDYDAILETCLIGDLEWLEEEFKYLFRKGKITQVDKVLAAQIIDNVIESINFAENEKMLNLLSRALENISRAYPEFF